MRVRVAAALAVALAQVLDDPQHPYTALLRDSAPRPGWRPRRGLGRHLDEVPA